MAMKRHIGRVINTDRRCITVFMQIPSREDHALIIDADALPPRFHDRVMEIVDSLEGQKENTLANLLDRRVFSDTGTSLLAALHDFKYLRAEPVENIMMYPNPNNPCSLKTILEAMGKKIPVKNSIDDGDEPLPDNIRKTVDQIQDGSRFSPQAENIRADDREQMLSMANNMIIEAKMLYDECLRKRNEAFKLAPSLVSKYSREFENPFVPVQNTTPSVLREVLQPAISSLPDIKRSRGRPKKDKNNPRVTIAST